MKCLDKVFWSLQDIPALTAFPSRLVHQLSLSFENPPILLSTSGNKLPLLSLGVNFHPLHEDHLPCNIHLVNLRSLGPSPPHNHKTSEYLLVLHNIGMECSIEVPATAECSISDQVWDIRILGYQQVKPNVFHFDMFSVIFQEVMKHFFCFWRQML